MIIHRIWPAAMFIDCQTQSDQGYNDFYNDVRRLICDLFDTIKTCRSSLSQEEESAQEGKQ